jgi:hypothetical protein
MGHRTPGTFDTILAIVGMSLFAFFVLFMVATFQIVGAIASMGGVALVLYLRHPRRKEPEELDEKLPEERWDHGRAEYIEEIKKRKSEKETSSD